MCLAGRYFWLPSKSLLWTPIGCISQLQQHPLTTLQKTHYRKHHCILAHGHKGQLVYLQKEAHLSENLRGDDPTSHLIYLWFQYYYVIFLLTDKHFTGTVFWNFRSDPIRTDAKQYVCSSFIFTFGSKKHVNGNPQTKRWCYDGKVQTVYGINCMNMRVFLLLSLFNTTP